MENNDNLMDAFKDIQNFLYRSFIPFCLYIDSVYKSIPEATLDDVFKPREKQWFETDRHLIGNFSIPFLFK